MKMAFTKKKILLRKNRLCSASCIDCLSKSNVLWFDGDDDDY
jgi:hypothetical protein